MQYSIFNYEEGVLLRKIKEVKPRLSQIMRDRGLTQSQLEELSDVPQSAISRFDKQANHNDLHLMRLANALGISIEELFDITYEE